MQLKNRHLAVLVLLGLFSGSAASSLFAQSESSSSSALPDAPTPTLLALASAEQVPQDGPAPQNAQPGVGNGASREKAKAQIREQEHQRILGIIPAFNITYRNDAVSLTAHEKMSLAFRSSTDPIQFAMAAMVAGIREAQGSDRGFGWGPQGYGKRVGAAYLDSFDGTMIGNGILPVLLRQDPRYFRLGHGTMKHRLLYALAATVICKHDKTGKWEPNYSNVAGNIASGALSDLYYPSDGSGAGQAFTNGIVVTAQGSIGTFFQEFWPDISRKFLHKDPTHGLDAEAQAKSKK